MVPLGWAAKRSPGGAADSAHRKAGSSGRSSRTGEDEEGSQAWDAGPPENLVSRRAAAVLRHQRVPAQPQREPSHQGHAHLFISGSLCMHKAPVDVLEQSPIQGELITLIWALTKPYHCKRLTGSCRCPLWVGSDILPKGWGKHRRTNQSAAFASQTIPRSAVREQDEVDKEILGAGGGASTVTVIHESFGLASPQPSGIQGGERSREGEQQRTEHEHMESTWLLQELRAGALQEAAGGAKAVRKRRRAIGNTCEVGRSPPH